MHGIAVIYIYIYIYIYIKGQKPAFTVNALSRQGSEKKLTGNPQLRELFLAHVLKKPLP